MRLADSNALDTSRDKEKGRSRFSSIVTLLGIVFCQGGLSAEILHDAGPFENKPIAAHSRYYICGTSLATTVFAKLIVIWNRTEDRSL